MNPYLDLFLTFAQIGVCTFGGGYAMLPILHREIVENKGWATEEEMADYYAISQCTPGIIAVNVATFIGRKEAGIIGGIAATLGQVFPCLVIICVIAGLLTNFSDLEIVQDAFNGVRACVCSEPYSAKLSRMHNNSNVLAFGARVVGSEMAKMITEAWLDAEFEGGRHERRVNMLMEIENR